MKFSLMDVTFIIMYSWKVFGKDLVFEILKAKTDFPIRIFLYTHRN